MTNHVHLLITPEQQNSAGLMMKHLGQRYVQYINRTYRRSGTMW
jgi:putative transposase